MSKPELSAALAGILALGVLVREAHWNVRGDAFYAQHKMLGKFYAALDGFADEFAERIVQLDGTPSADAGPLPPVRGSDRVRLVQRQGVDLLRAFKVEAADTAAHDPVTLDLFIRASAMLAKQLWFVSATFNGSLDA